MSEDEARAAQAAAAEYMKHVPIGEVVISTVQTLIELGYRRTGLVQGAADERDLPQTEVAIEALRALVPVLERLLEPASVTALRGEIAQLQLAYARATEAPPADAVPLARATATRSASPPGASVSVGGRSSDAPEVAACGESATCQVPAPPPASVTRTSSALLSLPRLTSRSW